MGTTALVDLDPGLRHWLDEWAESRRNVSRLRQQADRTRIERYILDPRYLGSRRSITRLSADDIQAWIDRLTEDGVGNATIYASLMILRQVIDLARERGAVTLEVNPAREAAVPGREVIRQPTDDDVIPEDVLQRILENTDDTFRALVLLGARMGPKWEEALGLRTTDVYAEHIVVGRWRVIEKGGHFQEEETGTSRLVEMTADLHAELTRFLADTADWRTKDWDWVFLTKRDHRHPLRPNFTTHVWRPALRAAGIDERKYTYHSLRHTAAHHMIFEEDWPIAKVAGALGHTSPTTTRKMYGHWFKEREERRDGASKRSK